jgi:hypothetical protein
LNNKAIVLCHSEQPEALNKKHDSAILFLIGLDFSSDFRQTDGGQVVGIEMTEGSWNRNDN